MERKDDKIPLNVGEKFVYICQGNFPSLDMASLELRLEEKDKYAFKVFKVAQPSSSELRLESTSYMVGEHDLKAVQLTDATHAIILGGIKFNVESVQDPQSPQKEPFPPLGPLTIFPWFLILLVVVGLSILGGLIGFEAMRVRLRRRLMQEIDTQTFQYGPMQEFYRTLRGLQRRYLFLADAKAAADPKDLSDALGELDKAFRLYLARGHRLPAHKWSSAKVCSELRSHSDIQDSHLADLRLGLSELDRAKASNEKALLSPLDLEQILKLLKAFIDEDERMAREKAILAQGGR